ncbi:unnamed protein product [Sphagnum jensenii]|uniref:Uncharacterized protein n=1 Tax=Sphagnum jensenii TaxID=128206 RepID=A0ABP1ARG6_9BRYO
MELQPDRLCSSAFPTAQHNLGLTHDSDQPHNSTTVQLDESGLSCGDAELLSYGDKSDTSGENLNAQQSIPSAAGASEQQPSSDTKPEVPKTGNAAQENEESVKGVAESSNNLQQTEGSSDPSMAGVNSNESTDEHVEPVGKHGEAMQKDDTSQLAQFTPGGPLPPSEPQNVSSADESTAEKKIGKQKGLVDDDQQQQQEQICPSGAGALKDEPPSNTKLEAANTGNADQETENPGGAEPSNNLQQTESSSDQQQQQDLSKSNRDPLCQLVSASVFNSLSQPVKTELAQLTKDELLQRLQVQHRKEIQRLKNYSHDLEINFNSKLNELHQAYRAECRRFEKEREKFMAKQEEMYLQMNCLQEEKDKLVEQILHLEQQHADKSSQGGSYLDDSKAATPALLSAAVSTVRDTGRKFTKEFMDQLKKCPVNIRSEVEGRILQNFKVAIPQATHKKFQYQAYMNQKLFDGFDNCSFSTLLEDVEKPPSDFLSMQQAEWYRKKSFQQFQEYDLRKFTVKMLVENAKHDLFLKKFCFLKFQAIFDKHTENQLFGHLEHSNCILQMEQHPNTPFYTSFCKFAVSVWLVHRLAFAFKTPATTFIVEEGLPFDCLKMESAGPADDITPDSTVGFVVLPGFQVSQSTIPCEVYLVEKTQDTPVVGGQVTHLQTLNAYHENSTTGN